MNRLIRSCIVLGIASLAGCGGADQGIIPGSSTPASPAAKVPIPESPIREMKPAEKPDESRPEPPSPAAKPAPSDDLPELAPPAGAKDERSDAKPK